MLAAAVAAALMPCAPALAEGPSCRMSGCEKSPVAVVSPATCCCAATGAPAVAGAPITVTAPTAGVSLHAAAPGDQAPQTLVAIARQVDLDPPVHVPLFLLNETFLI
jgi:hypothetical protein